MHGVEGNGGIDHVGKFTQQLSGRSDLVGLLLGQCLGQRLVAVMVQCGDQMGSFASGCGGAFEGFTVDGQIAREGTFLLGDKAGDELIKSFVVNTIAADGKTLNSKELGSGRYEDFSTNARRATEFD